MCRERTEPIVADEFAAARFWRPWVAVAELFVTLGDPAWTVDRDRIDHEVCERCWGSGDDGGGHTRH
jgi:hypothetical protein